MKINEIKNVLNSKVSAMNIQAPMPAPIPAPAPKEEVHPAPAVNPRTEEKPVKKESDRKAKSNKG